MNHEPAHPLFDGIPAPIAPRVPDAVIRKRAIKRAFERADTAFLASYERLLMVFGQIHPVFIAAEVTAYYESRHGKIAEHNNKGLGWLYGSLQKQGVIEKTGKARPRKNGNVASEYRLK